MPGGEEDACKLTRMYSAIMSSGTDVTTVVHTVSMRKITNLFAPAVSAYLLARSSCLRIKVMIKKNKDFLI